MDHETGFLLCPRPRKYLPHVKENQDITMFSMDEDCKPVDSMTLACYELKEIFKKGTRKTN